MDSIVRVAGAPAPRSKRGAVRFGVVIFLILGLGAAAAVAYRILTNRPGEEAVRYLPASSWVVVTLDTNPSPDQVGAFQQIRAALQREGLDSDMEQGLSSLFSRSVIAKELRPYALHSFAFGMWGEGGKTGGAFVVAISDPDAVLRVLKSHTKPAAGHAGVYMFEQGGFGAVIDEYLVISGSAEDIATVMAVRDGRQNSAADSPEFVAARSQLPDSANLMMLGRPGAMEGFARPVTTGRKISRFDAAKWFAVSLTVRADGLQVNFRSPIDSGQWKSLQAIQSVPAVKMSALRFMPDNAFGVYAVSQPSSLWSVIEEAATQDPKGREEMDREIAKFEARSGLSVRNDLLPALSGEMIAALYPTLNTAERPVEFLVVVDSSNGANPVAAVEKLTAAVRSGRIVNDSGEVATVSESVEDGVTVYRVSGARSPRRNLDAAFYCVADGSVLVSSSLPLLKRAIGCSQSRLSSLADSTDYQSALAQRPHSSGFMLADLRRIVKESTKHVGDDQGRLANAWLKAVSGPLVAGGRYDGTAAVGDMLIPVDWDALIRAIGESKRSQSRSGPSVRPTHGEIPAAM